MPCHNDPSATDVIMYTQYALIEIPYDFDNIFSLFVRGAEKPPSPLHRSPKQSYIDDVILIIAAWHLLRVLHRYALYIPRKNLSSCSTIYSCT